MGKLLMMLKLLGLDPSLRNWGYSLGSYDLQSNSLSIDTVGVIQPVLPSGKQARVNSLDLESAYQHYQGCLPLLKQADAVFVEVPVGSQSARAMASYGICVGVLGAIRGSGHAFFEVTPTAVKMLTVGKKTATKDEMIDWATNRHPEANWPMYLEKGKHLISKAKAEHMADATAAIYAGLQDNSFKQYLQLLQKDKS